MITDFFFFSFHFEECGDQKGLNEICSYPVKKIKCYLKIWNAPSDIRFFVVVFDTEQWLRGIQISIFPIGERICEHKWVTVEATLIGVEVVTDRSKLKVS